ncbi:MAG: DNA translocase FtsK 4TM domain-containing protein, partial [Lachnospiraceae bacterium]|nr:DNA translocase FtsK 4TM domain-containing protein [Lachnospiraceae bacterium]
MATNNTKKATNGNRGATKKTTEKKASTRKAAAKNTSKVNAEVKQTPKEELVPELSNELVLLITLVVSVLLFLSNFSLSGKVGEVINQITFGLFGVLAYIIPFFLFFGIAFYLANKTGNRRYVIKLVASIGLFAIVAAIIQLVFGETTNVEFLEYYKICAKTKSGGGLLGGAFCWVLTPLFGKVGTYVVLIALALVCVMILTGKALFALLAEFSGQELEKQKELHKLRAEERKVQREEQRILREEQLMQREEQLRAKQEEFEQNRSKAQSFLLPKEEPKAEQPKKELKRNFFGGFSSTDTVGATEEMFQN